MVRSSRLWQPSSTRSRPVQRWTRPSLRAKQRRRRPSLAHGSLRRCGALFRTRTWDTKFPELFNTSSVPVLNSGQCRDARREYDKLTGVSTELAERRAAVGAESFNSWSKLRPSSDFATFAPALHDCFDVAVAFGEAQRRPGQSVYDACLDNYERGMTAARLDTIFGQVQSAVAPLLAQVLEKDGATRRTAPLRGEFPVQEQLALTKTVLSAVGFEHGQTGRVDLSAHPFSTSFSPHDLRITTRLRPDEWYQGLAGTMHEFGHSLYEGQLADSGLPVDAALSMGVHESQSLFWERHIGLSRPFFSFLGPLLRKHLPAIAAAGFSDDELHVACNAVSAGLIRVEADELAYPLHVILRYDIERKVVAGQLDVEDVPTIWNAQMQELLGVQIKNNAEGCMQDVHWATCAVGYFPTYLLGAVMAAQLDHHARQHLPDMDELVAAGDFGPIKAWLQEKIHAHGSLYPSMDELLVEAVGEPLDPQYFIRYLRQKYMALYDLPESRL
eukprot:SAG31_NODE_843_length_11551_cov_6.757772_9_plen_500_part_00